MKVAEKLVETLRDLGVKYVFGVPSGGWTDYMEALRKTEGIEFVLTTHEGGAAMMAEVCGRLTGIPGVCFGTFGPGATNLATGVGEALLDRSPMIALTDEMPEEKRGRIVQMGIDHQALFQPLTKKTTRLTADAVASTLHDAAAIARTGRPGPVHVGLPVGMSSEIAAEEYDVCSPVPGPVSQPSAARLSEALDLLQSASKPLLAVGLGAVNMGLHEQILAFANKFSLPVILTPMAKGMLPETHPGYAGVVFHALSDVVGQTHREADLIVAAGYDPIEFNFEDWMPEVPLINLDLSEADIDREVYSQVLDVVGDVSVSLEYLITHSVAENDWDLAEVVARKDALFARLSPSSSNTLGPTKVLEMLRAILPADGIMTCDVGAHTHLIGQKWLTPAPKHQLMTNGWSTMGFGLPAAIAAKLCFPEKQVCAVVGDGGFLMTVGELATAVRYRLKVVIVLLTDNDLALIRIKQERKGYEIYGTEVRSSGVAGGDVLLNVPVFQADSEGTLAKAFDSAFAVEGPAIVEVQVDSREYDELVLKKDK
jgi:acetolactate synthase-1/2/3 large subunit